MLLAAEVETLQPSLISSLKPTKMVSCGKRFNKYVDDVDRLKKVNNKDYCTPPKQKKHKNMSLQKKGVAFSSRKALVLLSVHVSEVANGKLLLAAWWRCVDEWGPVVIVTPPTTNMSPKEGLFQQENTSSNHHFFRGYVSFQWSNDQNYNMV